MMSEARVLNTNDVQGLKVASIRNCHSKCRGDPIYLCEKVVIGVEELNLA
jgi:hypothetical protein